nr:MAG TPA: hypothetical protein [Caudoviricetes sp.]
MVKVVTIRLVVQVMSSIILTYRGFGASFMILNQMKSVIALAPLFMDRLMMKTVIAPIGRVK